MTRTRTWPFIACCLTGLLLASCAETIDEGSIALKTAHTAFTKVAASQSGISFRNDVVQNEDMNVFTNQNTLNGGGVAVGDVNNDGLPDLYFSANQQANRLYLNQGKLQFNDITEAAGVAGNSFWATGVTIVDVNADGWNDIYVCHAGNYLHEPQKRANELFINNGDANERGGVPTFTEKAAQFGLNDENWSVTATFFDYDNDNDLDVYVVNHPFNFNLPIELRVKAETVLPPDGTDKLFRNDVSTSGKFTDITYEAGAANWAFGHSASVADLNGDGNSDLFVANDYSEKDRFLVGTGNPQRPFLASENEAFAHISNFSMGTAIADFNNDLLPDLFVADMMAEDNRRKKTNMGSMKPEVFWDNVALGRHHQYMQNVLQLNNGNGTFSDVAELAGVAYTDWSWSAIFSDLDNDGWKDLFVSNGLALDIRNSDVNQQLVGQQMLDVRKNFREHLAKLPSEPIDNYAFRNNGASLSFSNFTTNWGLNHVGFSNGAAICDLDRDGDLDVVVNNLNDNAVLFENHNPSGGNYLQVQPVGPAGNASGIGLKAVLTTATGQQLQQVSLAQGYLSCAEPLLHFGLGNQTTIEKLELTWPDGKQQVIENTAANQLLRVEYKNAIAGKDSVKAQSQWFASVQPGLDFEHHEIPFDDYTQQVLLPHKYSQQGPKMCSGDVNGDGLTDLVVGGASGQAAQLFMQLKTGEFQRSQSQPWAVHSISEDAGMLLFDADGDTDLDLYVASGSSEWSAGATEYRDRLYVNDGHGHFSFSAGALPDVRVSSSCVKAADIDGDGDLDLFVGGRSIPGNYPAPASSQLLLNNHGIFSDVTKAWAPDLLHLGMVTDAQWLDMNSDNRPDLAIVGEWMPLTLFENTGSGFTKSAGNESVAAHVGWWYSLHAFDADADGDLDLVAGNLGQNSRYQASENAPFEVYARDFDQNGTHDIVLGYYNGGTLYPVRGRSCSSEQIPAVASAFPSYAAFGNASLKEVYGQTLDGALHYAATTMATSYFQNKGDGSFTARALPPQAQRSTVNGIASLDVNRDGHMDLLLAGNLYAAEIETVRHDASIGVVLLGNGKGDFEPVPWTKSGFAAVGDVKDLLLLQDAAQRAVIVVAVNDSPLQVLRLK